MATLGSFGWAETSMMTRAAETYSAKANDDAVNRITDTRLLGAQNYTTRDWFKEKNSLAVEQSLAVE